MGGLSAEERALFAERGWLVKPGVFPPRALAALQDAISLQLDALVAALVEAGKLAPQHAFEGEPFATRLGRVVHALPDEASKMEIVSVMSALMFPGYDMSIYPADPAPLADAMIGCLRHAPLVDAVASLLGTHDIVGQSSHGRWIHSDAAYYILYGKTLLMYTECGAGMTLPPVARPEHLPHPPQAAARPGGARRDGLRPGRSADAPGFRRHEPRAVGSFRCRSVCFVRRITDGIY